MMWARGLAITLAVMSCGAFASYKRCDQVDEKEKTYVSGSLLNVIISKESIMYVTVTISFQNMTQHPLTIEKYEIVWPSGRFEGRNLKASLNAGEIRDFKIRVSPEWGNLTTLRTGTDDVRVTALKVRL